MQQIVEIPLNGVSTTPSDYASPEGDLSFTSGVSNTKGSWQPQPKPVGMAQQIPNGYKLAYIHETSSGRNYILRNATGLCFMREGQASVVEGNVDEAERAALYAQYVAPHDGILRSINEQIMVKQQKLSLVGDETEAETKLNEFVDLVNAKFIDYLRAYDVKNSTNKEAEWNALSAIEKWERIDNDFNREIIIGSLDNPDTLNVYSTVYPVWYAYQTLEGNYILKAFTQSQLGYGNANIDSLLADTDNNAIFYVSLISGSNNEFDFISGPSKAQYDDDVLNDRRQLQTTVAALLTGDYSEDEIDTNVPEISISGARIYYGNKTQIDLANRASTQIDELCEIYSQYYYVAEAYTNRANIEAELDALLNDRETAMANREADYALYENAIISIPKYIYKGSVKQIVSIGNTLTILSDNPIYNLVWKDGEYLGFEIPVDPIIRFELNGEYAIDNIGDIHYTKALYANYGFKKFITRKVVNIHDLPTSRNYYHVIPPKSFTQNVQYKTIYNFDFSSALPTDIYIDNPEYDEDTAEGNGQSPYLHGHFEFADAELEFGIVYENGQYEEYTMNNPRLENRKFSTSGIFIAQDNVKNFVVKGTIRPYYLDSNDEWLDIPSKTIRDLCESFTYEVLRNIVIKSSYLVGQDSIQKVLTETSSFIKEVATDANKFMFPFFLRYGYEMYDGSISYLSAPILMLPNTGNTPSLYINEFEASVNEATKSTDIAAVVAKIMFTVVDDGKLQTLKQSASVVKNIVFAITAENYTFDDTFTAEDNKPIGIEYAADINEADERNWSYVRLEDELYEDQVGFAAKYGSNSLYQHYMQQLSMARVILPEPEIKKFRKGVENNSTYYIVKKIPVEELTTRMTELELEDGTLASLTSRTVLDTSQVKYNKITASAAMVYNRRLNLANIKETITQGWNPATLMTYSRGYTNNISNNDGTIYYRMVLHCVYEGNSYDVDVPYSVSNNTPLSWIFSHLPVSSADVYKIVGTSAYKTTIVTKEHPFLNGYYALANSFDGFEFKQLPALEASAEIIRKNSLDSESGSVVVPYKNKLYLSKVSDPLTFDLGSTIFVGNGEILALSSANKPISEGQFGQFPLYAFTTHGVWALEVKADGTYAPPKPITRDVVTNINSITQLDDSVVFVSKRGLMLLTGGQSQCLSDNIDDTAVIHVPTAALTGSDIDITINPKAILQGCNIIYDYPNQRLVCYNSEETEGNKTHPYALVFSLKNQQWSYIINDMQYSINSYPDALVIDDNGSMLDMTNTNVDMYTPFIIYTRPFRISEDDYKTVNELRINGVFAYNHIRCILQASNDLLDWQSVASSETNTIQNRAGTPYRFFRLVLAGSLASYESISSFTVKFTPKTDANVIGH